MNNTTDQNITFIRDVQIPGKHGKPILIDFFYRNDSVPKPIVVFSHGFKGFKDWGHFNLVAERFAQAGFVFVKFNFSHNGTTADKPDEFADLEAFGNNNFSIELDDLGSVIDYIFENQAIKEEIDKVRLYLMGHSRGGGVVLLKAHEDSRVKKVVTWASVSDYGAPWSDKQLQLWKKEGVIYIPNSRTGQQMPLYYQLCEDYFANKSRLDIPAAVKSLNVPVLVVHGTADEAVSFKSAQDLCQWNKNFKLFPVEEGNHVFGARHPYNEEQLPVDAEKVVQASIDFFKA